MDWNPLGKDPGLGLAPGVSRPNEPHEEANAYGNQSQQSPRDKGDSKAILEGEQHESIRVVRVDFQGRAESSDQRDSNETSHKLEHRNELGRSHEQGSQGEAVDKARCTRADPPAASSQDHQPHKHPDRGITLDQVGPEQTRDNHVREECKEPPGGTAFSGLERTP